LTDHSHALAALLDRARRRHLIQLVVEQTGVALGSAFAGAVLLLLFGTQILNWYWLVLLFVGSFGIGLWRTVRRVPSRYRLAQIIDSRLSLHDTLSTAFFFESGKRPAPPELLEYQHEQAERLARGLDAAAVFPLRTPKALYAVAGIALVAFGMFAIRYGVTHSLDLKPSLVKIAFDTFWKPENPVAGDKKNPLQRKIEEELKKLGINLGSPDAQPKEQDTAQESAMQTVDGADVKNAESSDNAQAKASNVPSDQQPGDGEKSDKGERASGSEDQNADNQPADSQGVSQNGKQDSGQKNGSDQNSDKSSMMDRMRDAMANLLNKLKMQPKASESRQQTAQDSKSGRGQSQSQKGAPTPGKPQSNGSDSPDQQGQQQGQGDRTQSAQGKSGDKSADHQPSQDAKSGIGKDDGDKSAREAEQLAAMGKISEILGKRAQNLTGELMVEVAGGNQQLKTQYSGSVGKHAEAGGEISRDEVPLMYRDFVQQYFEQIRKTAPAGAAAKAKAAEVLPGKKPTKVSE
jgi:hypothetical protein